MPPENPGPPERNEINLRRVPADLRLTGELLRQPFVVLGLIHIVVLAFQIPLFSSLAGWLFRPQWKTLGPWYLVLALAAIPGLALWTVRIWRNFPARALGVLILLGYLFQQGFAWSEGRGLDGMRDRIVTTGHAEFASIAVQQPSMWDVARDYETRLQTNSLGRYAHSKPPGQLLFYMATERCSRLFASDPGPEARLAALRTFAAVAWPLLAYLVLIPLFFLLRQLADLSTAHVACVLYLMVPSVTLITLHTDECLYPLLVVTAIWLAVVAQRERSWAWAMAAGAAIYLAAFFSFALLLAAPLAAACALAVEAESMQPPATRRRSLAVNALSASLGFGALFLLVALCCQYDFFDRLRHAVQYNDAWKYWKGGLAETFHYAWFGYLEFAVWLGLPLAVLSASRVGRATMQAAHGDFHGLTWPALSLAAVFLYLGFFGRAKGETGRLWLPLVPLCCAFAAQELQRRHGDQRQRFAVAAVALQWLTVYFTKARLDFW